MQRLCLLRVSICRVCGSSLFFLLGRRGGAFWPSRPLLEVIAIHQLRLLCLWRHRGGGNGFKWQPHDMLAPGEIVIRIKTILTAAERYLAQIPEAQLDTMLPHRPRSYRQLSYHIFQIPQVFLDHVENDEPYTYEALISQLPADINTRDDLMHYARSVQDRLNRWWATEGTSTDFNQPGNVYYGEVSLHEVLERTAWHSGQHTRQLMLTLETIGVEPDGPLQASDFSGLPMPRNAWDNEKNWS